MKKADPPPPNTSITNLETIVHNSEKILIISAYTGAALTALITDNVEGITKKVRIDAMGIYTSSPLIYATAVVDAIYDTTTVISSLTFGLDFGTATWSSGSITVWGSTS